MKEYSQKEKEDLIGKCIPVTIKYKNHVFTGKIKGSWLKFSVVTIDNFPMTFEISWELADRAVNQGMIIQV